MNDAVAIVGAGAVGGYCGALLAAAGVPVTMIARPAQVAALRDHGLRWTSGDIERQVVVVASSEPSAIASADVVLVCVKSGDTEAAGRAMASFVRPGVQVCSLQNGVDNAQRLQALLGVRVWPVPIYVAVDSVAPGHVKYLGGGEVVVPDEGDADGVAGLFGRAGLRVRRCADVDGAVWTKLILNCAWNALSAITAMPYGELMRRPGVPDVLRDVVAECMDVARAAGIALEADVFQKVERIAHAMPAQFSSTAQDLRRGRRTEIDDLNGAIVRRAQALGIDTPVNRALIALVKAMESPAPGALSGSTAAADRADRS